MQVDPDKLTDYVAVLLAVVCLLWVIAISTHMYLTTDSIRPEFLYAIMVLSGLSAATLFGVEKLKKIIGLSD